MKIAMMVRGYLPAPRPDDIVYAPIDLAVTIGEGLAKRGHKVDFYGPEGTKLKVPVKTRKLRALASNYKEFQKLLGSVDLLTHYVPSLWDQYLSSEMFLRASKGDYDILHFHHPETAMPFAKLYPNVPVAYTLHDPIYGWYLDMFNLYDTPSQYYISISDSQRVSAPKLTYAGTVYNGIDLKKWPFSPKGGDYLLIVGRIVREKGVREAIKIAKQTGDKLLIIGPTYEDKLDYFERYIKPELNDKIKYLGYINHNQVMRYYQKAKALLLPIQWDEPFGLTMIEAMACGTPVVALNRGSAPEVVVNGKTGFVVNSLSEMVRALQKIDQIKRKDCYEHVKQNFSIENMVDGYEKAFLKVLEKTRIN